MPRRWRSRPVLSSAGPGDDPVLPMRLVSSARPSTLLILVATGVVEVLALERDLGYAKGFGQASGGSHGVGRPLYSCSRVSSSAWKASSTQALRNASSSSSRAATSASGTKRPPYRPKCPQRRADPLRTLLVGVADRWMLPGRNQVVDAAPGSAGDQGFAY